MAKRGYKVALVAVIATILVLGVAGFALAQGGWSDLPLSVLGKYGITAEQVGAISDGYPDGTWRPYNTMPRQQFVKMAVDAYKIPLATPEDPTYSDVPTDSLYYPYIEGATAAGLVNGTGSGQFSPLATITREQAVAIISRWVAEANGYDLATYYTDAQVAAILATFPDGDEVSPSLQREMAFAIDMGIIKGNAFGELDSDGTLVRIQGAAMLIRSWAIVPVEPPAAVPAAIELVGPDKQESLIGLTKQVTFQVTDADGDPIEGVLVDFDVLVAKWHVGNVEPEAVLTDADGKATANIWSTEIGIENISAAVIGLKPVIATQYWLALDEVYIMDTTRESQNNAGEPHTWSARVMVFGPGPLSAGAQDWYNLIKVEDVSTTPADELGMDAEVLNRRSVDPSSYNDELKWAEKGYAPRSLPDIPVHWTLENLDSEAETSATITAVTVDIGEIADDGQSAWAATDASGTTTATITSDKTGSAVVTVIADYEGNPYPGFLFNHETGNDFGNHFDKWNSQPVYTHTRNNDGEGRHDGEDDVTYQQAVKTWIPHTLPPGGDSPIDPAFSELNVGEEQVLTITLLDVFGNPIEDRQVEWFMQGVGFFLTDDQGDSQSLTDPAGNKDFDTTDENGQATVVAKSLKPGEQIVHAKVRDKGTGGAEGSFVTYDAEVQWFDVDVVTFDDPTTTRVWDREDDEWEPVNEAVATNPVGESHDFTVNVWGLKLELDPNIDEPAHQTPYIDTDAAGHAYDGIFDWRDAEYLGGVLLVNQTQMNPTALAKGGGYLWPYDENGNGIIEAKNSNHVDERGHIEMTVQGKTIVISGEGGYTEFDWNHDGYLEPFYGQTGIYLPLEGKTVNFDLGNGPDDINPYDPADPYDDKSNLGEYFDGYVVDAVGDVSPESAETDENGQATVTVTSETKGPETVRATVTYPENPHRGSQLRRAFAKKLWQAGAADGVTVTVTLDGVDVTDGGEVSNPIDSPDVEGGLNSAHIDVHVTDEFGNDLPDYEVVYTLEFLQQTLGGAQGGDATYIPLAGFDDLDTQNLVDNIPYDQNGELPDSNEPTPESDPYAVIVGDGGTSAFYFNNWLGSEKPAVFDGVPTHPEDTTPTPTVSWPTGRVPYAPWELNGGVYVAPDGQTLVADGAKAWTLNGFTVANDAQATALNRQDPTRNVVAGDIIPNELTGSNIDVKLLEDPRDAAPGLDYETIIQIQVYAPADGVVQGGTRIYSKQIHKIWEPQVLDSMVLEQQVPGSDPAEWTQVGQDVTIDTGIPLRVQMLDEFDHPIANTFFDFAKIRIGGTVYLFDSQQTDAEGYLYYTFFPSSTGSLTFQAWNDLDNDNVIDASELRSNSKTDTVQPGTIG